MYNCERCKKEVSVNYGSGRFCSRSCANARTWTDEDKMKKSIAGTNSSKVKLAAQKFGEERRKQNRIKGIGITRCEFCGKSLEGKRYCNIDCAKSAGRWGGYRKGSERAKSGWFSGVFCGSSWELAFLLWSLDHKLPIRRCSESFTYVFDGTSRQYHPDFLIDDIYIEIKGWDDGRVTAKISQFPSEKKLVVLWHEEMKSILTYVKEVYGANFIELYEGNPHNQKHNLCLICKNPCKLLLCSRKCSMKSAQSARWGTRTPSFPD